MKSTNEIPAGMPENRDLFRDPFFERFELRLAPKALKLDDRVTKHYQFPTFYSDVTCAIGIFMCDYDAARKLLPDPRMKPIRMTLGRSLVAFSCYEYKNVMQVAPYNEISMMIPVQHDPALQVPVLPMVLGPLFPSFGYYVFSMPVTSKENQIRGNKIWGLPKVTQDIDVTFDDRDCTTTAYDEKGEPYFTLRVPMSGKKQSFDVRANLFSKLEDRLLVSRTAFKADFAVTKNMGALFKKDAPADRAYLTIGESAAAKQLRELKIEAQPFQFRFARHMNAAFDLPHRGQSGVA